MPELDATGLVRLLINQATGGADGAFSDEEVGGFLALESQSVKRAAAQAIDVIASNEALVSKVITDRHLSTDGSKTAAALRAHATSLREQARDDEDNADGGFYAIVELEPRFGPELTERPVYRPYF